MADSDHNSVEIWEVVADFPGYLVSNRGRIVATRTGKEMKQHARSDGYSVVRLSCEPKPSGKTVTAHRLVARAFLGPRPNGHQVNHIDGNKANNLAGNLEYCTPSENALHAVRLGLIKTGVEAWPHLHPERLAHGDRNGSRTHPEAFPRGEGHRLAKLTEGAVREIRRLAVRGGNMAEMARMLGVNTSTVQQVVRGKSWRHVA